MSPYLTQIIISALSSLIIFLILGFSTRNIIRTSQIRLFLSLLFSVSITIMILKIFEAFLKPIGEAIISKINYFLFEVFLPTFFITNTKNFDYYFFEVFLGAIIVTIIFGFFIRNYLNNSRYGFTGLVTFLSYIIINYWFAPLLINGFSKLTN